jgi:hypothetical protein
MKNAIDSKAKCGASNLAGAAIDPSMNAESLIFAKQTHHGGSWEREMILAKQSHQGDQAQGAKPRSEFWRNKPTAATLGPEAFTKQSHRGASHQAGPDRIRDGPWATLIGAGWCNMPATRSIKVVHWEEKTPCRFHDAMFSAPGRPPPRSR